MDDHILHVFILHRAFHLERVQSSSPIHTESTNEVHLYLDWKLSNCLTACDTKVEWKEVNFSEKIARKTTPLAKIGMMFLGQDFQRKVHAQ